LALDLVSLLDFCGHGGAIYSSSAMPGSLQVVTSSGMSIGLSYALS
jgi:hypothetical protein